MNKMNMIQKYLIGAAVTLLLLVCLMGVGTDLLLGNNFSDKANILNIEDKSHITNINNMNRNPVNVKTWAVSNKSPRINLYTVDKLSNEAPAQYIAAQKIVSNDYAMNILYIKNTNNFKLIPNKMASKYISMNSINRIQHNNSIDKKNPNKSLLKIMDQVNKEYSYTK